MNIQQQLSHAVQSMERITKENTKLIERHEAKVTTVIGSMNSLIEKLGLAVEELNARVAELEARGR